MMLHDVASSKKDGDPNACLFSLFVAICEAPSSSVWPPGSARAGGMPQRWTLLSPLGYWGGPNHLIFCVPLVIKHGGRWAFKWENHEKSFVSAFSSELNCSSEFQESTPHASQVQRDALPEQFFFAFKKLQTERLQRLQRRFWDDNNLLQAHRDTKPSAWSLILLLFDAFRVSFAPNGVQIWIQF